MARVLRSGRSILAAIAAFAVFAAACGSDDDEQQRQAQAQEACKKYYDKCTNCTCQLCFCSAECENGYTAYLQCLDGCYSQPGGEAQLKCFDACKAAAPATTKARLSCAETALTKECATPCKRT